VFLKVFYDIFKFYHFGCYRRFPDLVDAQYTKNQAWKSDADTLGDSLLIVFKPISFYTCGKLF
jgi:hypothetical protein